MHHLPILIVEDRPDWQMIVAATLAQEGYPSQSATSYTEAVDLLNTHSFALAVVDPVLDVNNRFNRDGLSVIQRIRTLQPALPIVVITGSLTRDMQMSLQQLCPDAPVLLKETWNPLDFVILLRSLLGTTATAICDNTSPHLTPEPDTPELLPPSLHQCAPGCPRILLIENRPEWQTIVAQVLARSGYFWRVAATAQAALHELEQESFHLVILDLKLQSNELPLTSSEGWLLLDYLVESRPATRVVILSGRACPSDVAALLTNYPIIGFIEKQRFTPQAITDAVAQATRAPSLRLQTFGLFRIWRDNEAITGWERPQAEHVVKMLLVRRAQGGRAVTADEIITRLWPDTDEHSGRKKLLPLISNARRTLEPDIEPRDSHFIVRSSNGYFFELGAHVTWDLLTFRDHLRLGRQLLRDTRPAAAITELEKARALYLGDFLAEDSYTDWIIDIRREIVSDFCDALIELADSYATLHRYPAAIDACTAALHKDPLREGVYRRLMCLYATSGDKGQALKVYRDCTMLFEELFGEAPTRLTRTLAQAIASDDPAAHHLPHWLG